MSKIDALRKRHCLAKSMKARSVLNHAVKASIPGAGYVLAALEALNGVLRAQKTPDTALQSIFDQLRQVRDAMCDYVLASTPDAGQEHEAPTCAKKTPSTMPEQKTLDAQPISPNPPPYGGILGTMPDTAAAKLLGISHVTARKRRNALGIPPFSGPKKRVDWARWDDKIVDRTMTADGLASLIGCDPSTVRERRRFLQSKKGKYAHE